MSHGMSAQHASSSRTPPPKIERVERVLFHSNVPRQKQQQPEPRTVTLQLTPHHFLIHSSSQQEDQSIPYTLINTLVRLPSLPTQDRHTRIYPLGIRLRTFQIYSLGFESESIATDVFETVKAYAVLRSPEQLYAFRRPPSKAAPAPTSGWQFYDPKKEFTRQGVGSRTKAWRFTDINLQYNISATYPNQLVVPTRISDQTLGYASKYRSKARIPALTYLHWANHGTITRCSQPLVGLKGNRSVQDEKLVEAIFSSHVFADPNSRAAQAAAAASAAASQNGGVAALGPSAGMVIYGATSTNLIVDARPTTNAMANVAKGAGSENMEHYRGCKKAYLGIDNIHVMRDSLNRVTEALKEAEAPLAFAAAESESSSHMLDRAGTINGSPRAGQQPQYNTSLYATYRPSRPGSSHSSGIGANASLPGKPLDTYALRRSNWLKHIAALLEGTMLVVRNIHINSSHVLLHCSDGWDRTAQIAALAQTCLDPYFRTLEGFAVLVEKDWLSFGHRFEDRSGHLGHPSRFVTDPGHGEPPAGEEAYGEDGNELGTLQESEGFEPQAAVNALWGFAKQLTAGFSGGGSSGGSGSGSSPTNLREISPVFHQYLDCVWQLMRQFPTRFEYNAAFLIEMHRQVYACEFGTFLLNCERERKALGRDDGRVVSLADTTPSVWDWIFAEDQKRKWINPLYDPSLDKPKAPPKSTDGEAPTPGGASSATEEIRESTPAAGTPTESPLSSSITLISNTDPASFGDMGVLLANPREVRFFADLFRRDEREMNALIIQEAQERARYAQRLADAAAGAMASKEKERLPATMDAPPPAPVIVEPPAPAAIVAAPAPVKQPPAPAPEPPRPAPPPKPVPISMNNPWAATVAADSYGASSARSNQHISLEDVFGVEQARGGRSQGYQKTQSLFTSRPSEAPKADANVWGDELVPKAQTLSLDSRRSPNPLPQSGHSTAPIAIESERKKREETVPSAPTQPEDAPASQASYDPLGVGTF